jgi:hypothetical protein
MFGDDYQLVITAQDGRKQSSGRDLPSSPGFQGFSGTFTPQTSKASSSGPLFSRSPVGTVSGMKTARVNGFVGSPSAVAATGLEEVERGWTEDDWVSDARERAGESGDVADGVGDWVD